MDVRASRHILSIERIIIHIFIYVRTCCWQGGLFQICIYISMYDDSITVARARLWLSRARSRLLGGTDGVHRGETDGA